MPKRGKKHKEALAGRDCDKRYEFSEAMQLSIDLAHAKFDESVDVAVQLGVDPRHADQMVRGTVVLPHGTGKTIRILVFARGEKEKEASDAGADIVGNDDLIEKIKGGWLEFDKAVATPDMMGTVGKIGKILGPRGLMPNAKSGTVTFDVDRAINDLKAGKIDFRVEKAGILHCCLGKVSFGSEKMLENLSSFFETVVRMKPASSKGTYIKNIVISTTMGPGIKIDPIHVKALLK
ncbi:MAG: 50S ribosomal protein L1 [Desulfobacteria bacterium]|jgi:large subunit ribosomal protein L1|nr:50S ribosomal protein L1 [Desulfobacterales bacterium]MDL1975623.1 50S ribosomal protein L1 [Deltaproteobacteria bacterium]OEU59286.1 MAG: 50S ribosomal protein L1 [Desulfobacterales bacterium C00003104]